MGGLEGKEENVKFREREEDGVVVEKRKDILEVLAMHWRGLGKVSQSGEDVPIENLKYKDKEVNWMMEPMGFQEIFSMGRVEEGQDSWSCSGRILSMYAKMQRPV